LHFGDEEGEYRTLTGGAGLVPLARHAEVELTGNERANFLNRLCTNKVDRLPAGTGAEAFLTDAKAHILAHLFVFARPECLVLFSLGAEGAKIASHLDRYLIREKVAIHDRTAQRLVMLLAGPDAEPLLRRLTSAELPGKHLDHTGIEVDGAAVEARAVDLGGQTALLLSCEVETAATVWKTLRQNGARACGCKAADAVRIEAGWPVYGRDITEDNLPQEVARDERTISFTKGCYLGQETVARIDSRGHVNRTLVGLRFHGAEVPAPGTELSAQGQVVGTVTSAAVSPRQGVAVALGYVRRGQNTPGFVLQSPAGLAEVTSLPMGR
jgi:folate-binding protein YgfZ